MQIFKLACKVTVLEVKFKILTVFASKILKFNESRVKKLPIQYLICFRLCYIYIRMGFNQYLNFKKN
jgi:hypothetical protein